MIMAKFCKGGDGSIRMVLKGHARTAPKGEDLICAAATTLAAAKKWMETQKK